MDQESHLPLEAVGELSVFIGQTLLKLRNVVDSAILRVRLRLVQSFTVFSVVLLLLCIAAFLYGSFYYSYMPRAAFSTPVHYYYRCVRLVVCSSKLKSFCDLIFFALSVSLLNMFFATGLTVNLLLLSYVLILLPTSL